MFLFKIIHGLVHCKLLDSLLFSNSVRVGANTRGHKYKLFRTRSHKLVLSNFFINRILLIWNGLPSLCFDIDRLSAFRRKLRYIDFSSFVKGPLQHICEETFIGLVFYHYYFCLTFACMYVRCQRGFPFRVYLFIGTIVSIYFTCANKSNLTITGNSLCNIALFKDSLKDDHLLLFRR